MTTRRATPAPPAGGERDPAVAAIAGARRALVTGLVGAPVEAARVACDLAEAVGAAVDFGQADLAGPAGPTIARAGAVTAAPEEMRDRADLVILWNCDPVATHPAFAAFLPPRAAILRLPPAPATPVDAARVIHQLLRGGRPPALDAAWVAACVAARAAIDAAACVAIVTDDATDPLGLGSWSVVRLVREIAHVKPAFEIPLQADEHAAAAAVCTWRYGAAGAIDRADRGGGRFLPGEAAAERLVDRREVDCVIAVGRLTDRVEAALARCGGDVAVVRVAAAPEPLRALIAALRDHAGGPDR